MLKTGADKELDPPATPMGLIQVSLETFPSGRGAEHIEYLYEFHLREFLP